METIQTREELAQSLLDKTRGILAQRPVDRAMLKEIEGVVTELSDQTHLWGNDDFPEPAADEQQNRYLIAQDRGIGLSLYLNVMRPGKKIPPHNHTTWACIGAVEGAEINTLYERIDDRSVEGKAKLKELEIVELKPGNALAMMANDIHSVEICGDDIIRHLHFYGQPLESLENRIMYDLENGSCKTMGIGVKTK
uniref:cysteine dioxygenase family protein n=1 Tax=Pararhizobium sp. IMCC3301 TaxID=3067904 RepID=UPI002741881A|nr:cysteine dioxygenase family protein [Pararhizobium sp. IMCC3301]